MPQVTVLLPALFLLACASQSSPRDKTGEAVPSTRVEDGNGDRSSCEAAYDSLVATGTVTLGVDGLAMGDSERIEFIPLADTREGARIQQINLFHGGRGVSEKRDHFLCADGIIELPRFDSEVGHTWQSYDPPLPWSRVPLEAGQTWSWTGFIHQHCENPDDSTPEDPRQVTARWRVLPEETLETAVGPLQTIPVWQSYAWTGEERPYRVQTTWFLAAAPMVIVHRERKYETAPGEFIEGRWTLISIETPPN